MDGNPDREASLSALAASEARYRFLADNVDEIITFVRLDAQGEEIEDATYVSPAIKGGAWHKSRGPSRPLPQRIDPS